MTRIIKHWLFERMSAVLKDKTLSLQMLKTVLADEDFDASAQLRDVPAPAAAVNHKPFTACNGSK